MKASEEKKLKRLRRVSDQVLFYVSLLSSFAILLHMGIDTRSVLSDYWFDRTMEWLFYLLASFYGIVTLFTLKTQNRISRYSQLILLFYFSLIITTHSIELIGGALHFERIEWIYVGIFGLFLVQMSKNSLFFDDLYFNPTILFVLSFLLLILLGTILIMLPNATQKGSISFVDAVFTATSAVCITGLTVQDLALEFTHFGQSVILTLVQIGGLGIMTFTGFFGYFFTGGFSYKNQVMYTSLIGENKVGAVVKTLYKIIFITFVFEAIGAALIFTAIEPNTFQSMEDKLFFSIFHAISAFCNAGFSTVEDGLHNPVFRFNYQLHLTMAMLIILGGFGFTIVLNIYTFIKRWIVNLYNRLIHQKTFVYRPWVINLTSRIILYTSAVFLIGGTFVFFLLEYNHALAEHPSLWGKVVSAFFLSTTARTAGFSTVSPLHLSYASVTLFLFFMWVGASPGSTGGGIKNTTFAIAFLNILAIVRGKSKIEVFKRQISPNVTKRSLAIVALSILVIGLAFFSLCITDADKAFSTLLFEVFSAFGTTGMTLGLTPELSEAGKIIITITMFIGRIGALTLLVAFVKDIRLQPYEYPTEEIQL